MKKTWVIGNSGLFGKALVRQLTISGADLFKCTTPFAWNNPATLDAQYAKTMQQFFDSLGENGQWQIIWAAGKSMMRSPEEQLNTETDALKHLLETLDTQLSKKDLPGSFGFASSAGAIYAQNTIGDINESTPISPSTAYAQYKLLQEQLLIDWSKQSGSFRTAFIGRISNLYGSHQDPNKRQGLISEAIRCYRDQRALNLFVPLETKRDYIWVDDAAQMFIWHLNNTHATNRCDTMNATRIIAQETSYSIQEIVDCLYALTGQSLKIHHSQETFSSAYPLETHFKSLYPITQPDFQRLSLIQGMGKMLGS
jgi:UDP-glucose 4-epimerase